MKSLLQVSKDFHKAIEKNPTILGMIDTLDKNNLSRVGFGIGIEAQFFHDFTKCLMGVGYEMVDKNQAIEFFEVKSLNCHVAQFSKNGAVDYYALYCPRIKFLAVRCLLHPEVKQIFSESFYRVTQSDSLEGALKGCMFTEGFSGKAFGTEMDQLKKFAPGLLKVIGGDMNTSFEMDSSRFNRLLTDTEILDSGLEVSFVGFEEKTETSLTLANETVKTSLVRLFSKGLILGPQTKLLGVYNAVALSGGKSVGVTCGFLSEETAKNFLEFIKPSLLVSRK